MSADTPEGKAESYVRGTKVVPVDAVNLDFEAVALMGDYDDVLTEDDVVAGLSKKSFWDRQAVCRKARARAAAEEEAARLGSLGIEVVDRDPLGEGYHGCDGDYGHPGLVAVVRPQAWGEGADITFYCDDESHVYQPTPEEVAETSVEVPLSDVKLGDEVWLYDGVYGKWESLPVVGFGQPEFNRIAVEVDAPNGRRSRTLTCHTSPSAITTATSRGTATTTSTATRRASSRAASRSPHSSSQARRPSGRRAFCLRGHESSRFSFNTL